MAPRVTPLMVHTAANLPPPTISLTGWSIELFLNLPLFYSLVLPGWVHQSIKKYNGESVSPMQTYSVASRFKEEESRVLSQVSCLLLSEALASL